MRRGGRALSPDEAELWHRVARTVAPLDHSRAASAIHHHDAGPVTHRRPAIAAKGNGRPAPAPQPAPALANRPLEDHRHHQPKSHAQGLDASWDRKLARGAVSPDFTLDLHGASLDAAHARLDHGLTLAIAQGARVVLLVTGRARPSSDHAGRSERRGAIRAKFLDWLQAGPHASRIAAIRPAHPRHGGAGAVYIVLRRPR